MSCRAAVSADNLTAPARFCNSHLRAPRVRIRNPAAAPTAPEKFLLTVIRRARALAVLTFIAALMTAALA